MAYSTPRRRSHLDLPREETYTGTSTYGTYIYPVDKIRYRSADPSDCYCNCCPHESRRRHNPRPSGPSWGAGSGNQRSRSSSNRTPRYPNRVHINVEDKTKGQLRQRHGRSFQLSVSSTSTAREIVSFLAPDRHEHKVMVRWRDGVTEPFDELVSLDDVVKDARELIIKDKKRVHWM